MHEEMRSVDFLVLASKPRSTVCQLFGLKSTGTVSSGLASKLVAMVCQWFGLKITVMVSWFGTQNQWLRFGDSGHKITATISWFMPQNQVAYGLSVAPQNQWEDEDGAGHASGSNSLFHLEVSRARVSQFCLKTSGGAMVDCSRGIIAEVTWK
jgi:hypothetical protein